MFRKVVFADGEYYHIYNRGTDGRSITSDRYDSERFLESLILFNDESLTGSVFEKGQTVRTANKQSPLIEIVAYCLNPNHYHLILKQLADRGIERFMHRVGTGYTNYFNEKVKRKGCLFQGRYKSVHVSDNDYLLHLSAYVNLNDKVHGIDSPLVRSSWNEYIGKSGLNFCQKDIVLGQFKNSEDYRIFAEDSQKLSWQLKLEKKELAKLGADIC